MQAGMIGLGKLGLPVAEAMARVHDVMGMDVRPVSTQLVHQGTLPQLVAHSDIIFIAVQTPHDSSYDGSAPTSHLPNRDFDYSTVCHVLDQLQQLDCEGKTVVLISTVLPGTTRSQLAPRLTKAQLIYNPYLIAMGTVAHDMVNPEMIMIGNRSGQPDLSTQQLISFYQPLMQNAPRVITGTWEEMECTKIFYNTFISAKLSLVNMIQDVAVRLGHMNADVTAQALAESTYRIMGPAYMKPGMGDGGPCHPRDNIALRHMAAKLDLGYDLFGSIMRAREVQAENLARELCSHGLPVVILGKSFKPGVPYTDGSYSLLVGHYCESQGATVTYDAVSAEPAAYLLGHQRYYTVELSQMALGSVVIDPWRSTTVPDGIKLVSYGNTKDQSPRVHA
jgi:UDPglucose 6-dehydrogenase